MYVLHIVSGSLTGGAARGAYWLHLGLRDLDVSSHLLTNSLETYGDENVLSVVNSNKDKVLRIFRSQADSCFSRFYRKRKRRIFSSAIVGFDFTKTDAYEKADIVHLHWINGGFINIKDLSKVDKPIVWTLRDMWPMTGGCHYAMDCMNYKTRCGKCVQLQSRNTYDLSRYVMKRKEKYLKKDIKIVGISDWISERARESSIFGGKDIRTIGNNINSSDFFPVNSLFAREAFGIKTKKKIILTGSTSTSDFYKGFSKFLEAVNGLDREKYFILFFGHSSRALTDSIGFEHKCLGYLYDSVSLRLAYSAADVFVAPSLMEAFGKTIAESMACGTPVVCFDATGPKDIVTHKVDGYKSIPFESQDLANGITWILDAPNYEKICHNAVEKVSQNFDSKVIARKYIELYQELYHGESCS